RGHSGLDRVATRAPEATTALQGYPVGRRSAGGSRQRDGRLPAETNSETTRSVGLGGKKRREGMRKLVRFGIAIAVLMSGFGAVASHASAHTSVITCNDDGSPGSLPTGTQLPQNPGVKLPAVGTPLDNVTVLGNQNPCADL